MWLQDEGVNGITGNTKQAEISLLLIKDQDAQQFCNILVCSFYYLQGSLSSLTQNNSKFWWTHLNFIWVCVIFRKKLLRNWLDLDKHPSIKNVKSVISNNMIRIILSCILGDFFFFWFALLKEKEKYHCLAFLFIKLSPIWARLG